MSFLGIATKAILCFFKDDWTSFETYPLSATMVASRVLIGIILIVSSTFLISWILALEKQIATGNPFSVVIV
jgi:hypothetical protein